MKKSNKEGNIDFDLGLGGFLKGLGSLVDFAKEFAEKNRQEFKKEGELGTSDEKGFKAVYGFSVKLGGEGIPTIKPFGNIHDKKNAGPLFDDTREPMTDVFDEGSFLLVVVEMPGINEKDVRLEVRKDILTIDGKTGDKKYHKEQLLPSVVDEKKISHSCKNGILEVKLWKPEKFE